MLKEKIEILYRLLDCNNSKIARTLGCAPSEISRLRNESRDYAPTSRPVVRFAEGIYMYADKTGALKPLCRLCEIDGDSLEEVVPALIAWIFDTEKTKLPSFIPLVEERIRSVNEQKKLYFGEKLGKVMDLLEISNMRLARSINVDASAVSRFRGGVRRPKPPIDSILVSVLYDRAAKQDKLNELGKLCGMSGIPDVSEFSFWIYDDSATDVNGVDNLLDIIEKFSPRARPDIPDISGIVPEEISCSSKGTYWGVDGLREAVLRFLSIAAREGGEMLLYSDQDMTWMVGDPEYRAKWTAMMLHCIAAGVKIRIIHNIDRGTGEMLDAIRSWMPLYISGMIDPYVCNLGHDARFAKTLFLLRGKACVIGSIVRGKENGGYYEYVTDEEKIAAHTAEFEYLLSHSNSLLHIYFDDYTPKRRNDEGNSARLLIPTLSFGSLPDDVLDGMLDRNGIGDKERAKIKDAHRREVSGFFNLISGGGVKEFICLPSDEDLFSGKVKIPIPKSVCINDLFYTPEEYGAHIEAVIRHIECNMEYEAVILPEMPFSQLQIMSTGKTVSVIRTVEPYAAFVFSELRLASSFEEYFSLLEKQYYTDRSTVKKKLMRFL